MVLKIVKSLIKNKKHQKNMPLNIMVFLPIGEDL